MARTPEPPGAFTAGWVRLTLKACLGVKIDAEAVGLDVEGADHALLFSPGRAGGATAGVLTATDRPTPGGVQRFRLPEGSAQAREVVLAPWPSGAPAPRISALRLVAGG